MSLDTKTRWGVGLPETEDDDPFKDAAAPVEQTGLPIDLTEGDDALLNDKLVDLVNSEGELWQRGVRCSLKEQPDSTCSACPLSKADEMGHPMATLCRIGREQERTVMELHVLRESRDGGQGT